MSPNIKSTPSGSQRLLYHLLATQNTQSRALGGPHHYPISNILVQSHLFPDLVSVHHFCKSTSAGLAPEGTQSSWCWALGLMEGCLHAHKESKFKSLQAVDEID